MYKRTNIELDIELLEKAMKITEISTIKQLVNESLKVMIDSVKRKKILDLEAKVAWEGDLDEMRKID